MRRRRIRQGPTFIRGACVLALTASPAPGRLAAQTMPGPAYHELSAAGHEKLARRIAEKLDHRSHPDAEDVRKVIERWTAEEGGPDTPYEWLAVTRLWLRAGRAAEAELAMHRAEGGVPPGVLLLDQARVAFLAHQRGVAERAYWKGCELADEAASLEYWLDVEPLATPDEIADWERFRTLPVGQRDLCTFLRSFWNERAGASGVPVRERIADHYDRLRFAIDNYTRRSGKKGPTFSNEMGRPRNASFDDRGLIYLRLGEPDRRTSFGGVGSGASAAAGPECFEPNESWAYDFPGGTRVFHFTTGEGLDDWWLVENLAEVYRCGTDVGITTLSPLGEGRRTPIALRASLLGELYASRAWLDSRYAQLGHRSSQGATVALSTLEEERRLTHEAAEFAIRTVPERPEVDLETRVLVEPLQYRALRPEATRVWLNGLVEADRLTPDTLPDGRLRYRVLAALAVLGEEGGYRHLPVEVETVTDRELEVDEGIPVRIPAELPPGRYRFTLTVRDERSAPEAKPVGNYHRDSMVVRDFSGERPLLSDVAVAADSGGTWSPGAGVYVRLSPAHTTGPDGVAFVYFEAYNLTAGGAYVTRVRLEPETGGEAEPFELTFPGEVPGRGVVRRYLRLDLRQTRPGPYRMRLTVEDLRTGRATLPAFTDLTVEESRPGTS